MIDIEKLKQFLRNEIETLRKSVTKLAEKEEYSEAGMYKEDISVYQFILEALENKNETYYEICCDEELEK